MADPFAVPDVVLLCHCDGTNGSTSFIDESPYAHTLTPTLATVSTTSPKFGTGSASFTAGAAARIDVGNATHFQFGADQFTAEAWGYFTAAPSATHAVLSQFASSFNLGWFFGFLGGSLSFFYSTSGSNNPSVGASYSPTLNTWIHLAADRDASNVLRVYVNGSVIASATVSSTFFASTQLARIGNDGNFNRPFPGRLDEVRVVRGTALYAGSFTPPTAPFDSIAASAQQYSVSVIA